MDGCDVTAKSISVDVSIRFPGRRWAVVRLALVAATRLHLISGDRAYAWGFCIMARMMRWKIGHYGQWRGMTATKRTDG